MIPEVECCEAKDRCDAKDRKDSVRSKYAWFLLVVVLVGPLLVGPPVPPVPPPRVVVVRVVVVVVQVDRKVVKMATFVEFNLRRRAVPWGLKA